MSNVDELLSQGAGFLDAIGALEGVAADDLGDLAVGLIQLTDRLSAETGLAAYRAGLAGAHDVDGSTSITAHLARRVDTSKARVSRVVSTGRFLHNHPVVADAGVSGSASAAHVDRLQKASKSSRNATVVLGQADTQSTLLGYADRHDFDDWCVAIRHWENIVDDDPETKAADAHEDRDMYLFPNFARAGYSGEINLGNLDGAAVREAIERLADQLFQQDLAEMREELGRDPLANEMPRSRPNLRADAFIELVERGVDATPSLTSVLPLVNIHIDEDTFNAALDWLTGSDDAYEGADPLSRVCETLDGHAITPVEAIQAAFEGHIRRIVFLAESETIDFGRKKRLFTGAAREAALQTGRWCQHPGCRRPARWCQIDHITAWQNGGTTNQTNAQTLCGYHNRWKYTHHDTQHANSA